MLSDSRTVSFPAERPELGEGCEGKGIHSSPIVPSFHQMDALPSPRGTRLAGHDNA